MKSLVLRTFRAWGSLTLRLRSGYSGQESGRTREKREPERATVRNMMCGLLVINVHERGHMPAEPESKRVDPSHENPHAAGAAQCRMAQRDLRQQNQCSLLPPRLNVLPTAQLSLKLYDKRNQRRSEPRRKSISVMNNLHYSLIQFQKPKPTVHKSPPVASTCTWVPYHQHHLALSPRDSRP